MTDETNERDDVPLPPEAEAMLRAEVTPASVVQGTRQRLLARAAADAAARGIKAASSEPAPSAVASVPADAPALTVSRGRGISPQLFAAVTLALAASLVLWVAAARDRDALRSTFAVADKAKDARLDSLRALVAAREDLVQAITGSQVRVVGLSAGATASPRALMFWDQGTNKWTFVAHHLAPLKAGRTYQLWLVTASAKISAGTFVVSPAGDALVQATYALDRSALKAVAVTEEPSGGVTQPTGPMVVVGTAATE